MSLAIVQIEPAPDFPRQDLSDTNADIISLMLANADLVMRSHASAESTSWVYRAGHPALRKAINKIIINDTCTQDFDHGISTYEAIAMLVQSVPEHCDMFTVKSNAVALATGFTEDALLDYIDTAGQRFTDQLPRTAEVVRESSERFFPTVPHYAVVGAAVARQFELDGIE